jgi:hypothetical protein
MLDTRAAGQAKSIFVSAGDVYVAGWTSMHKGGELIPCYWKNGDRIDLDLMLLTKNADGGVAYSIFVDGDKIYVCGATSCYIDLWNINIVPCLWKNGVRTDLGPISESEDLCWGYAKSISVTANDVYVCGGWWQGYGEIYAPWYWKNGVRYDLPAHSQADKTEGGIANSIFAAGNDVYIAGELHYDTFYDEPWSRAAPGIWKNGELTILSRHEPSLVPSGLAYSIAVSGSDVYAVGATNGSEYYIPCYWKNGERTDLSFREEAGGGRGYAIQLSGNDIYVAGCNWMRNGDYHTAFMPCYWKNGARTELSQGNGQGGMWRWGVAWSVFVVE